MIGSEETDKGRERKGKNRQFKPSVQTLYTEIHFVIELIECRESFKASHGAPSPKS